MIAIYLLELWVHIRISIRVKDPLVVIIIVIKIIIIIIIIIIIVIIIWDTFYLETKVVGKYISVIIPPILFPSPSRLSFEIGVLLA